MASHVGNICEIPSLKIQTRNCEQGKYLHISDISFVRPIKDQLPDNIEYHHIHVVIAMLQQKFGVSGKVLKDAVNKKVPKRRDSSHNVSKIGATVLAYPLLCLDPS